MYDIVSPKIRLKRRAKPFLEKAMSGKRMDSDLYKYIKKRINRMAIEEGYEIVGGMAFDYNRYMDYGIEIISFSDFTLTIHGKYDKLVIKIELGEK